ncbi:MAG: NADPH-dependent assimilatory sulfite reductase hemoprotein subunit [Bacteroidales bacterium]
MKILRDLKDYPGQLTGVEKIKYNSNYLRGTINESLVDEITGSISEEDAQVSKFHGIYQQTDRALTKERKRQKLEPYFMFMVRVRVPGGIVSSSQWLEMDRLSDLYGNNTLKLTTRQAFQFHGILKRNLKKQIQIINESLLDTIAACGDVNRNVMCSPNPNQSGIHGEVDRIAKEVSKHLTPATKAYHELWLENKLVAGGAVTENEEPLYGKFYLPRKFKIAFAIPPYNDTDIFTNDIGLIAIEKNGRLAGFNIAVGGGLGNTFGEQQTYPRLGDNIGFCEPDQVIHLIEKIVEIQRDHGDRENRKVARMKYTIDRKGLDWFKKEIEQKSGVALKPPRPYEFRHNSDNYRWAEDREGRWHYTVFVENGRVTDTGVVRMKSFLQEAARMDISDFRLTGNQNVILGNILPSDKGKLERLMKKYRVDKTELSGLRLNSLACVALNSCPLAFAEAETYLPSLIDKIDEITRKLGIHQDHITIRMTGCPNGCARPYNAEIAFVGRAPGIYNLYLGGNREGTRLNRLYKEMLKEEEILTELEKILGDYATNNANSHAFGDFVWEKNYVNPDIPLNI